jgi:chaperone modulatory protein CbpM
MESEQLIPVSLFCQNHSVDMSLIDNLRELGLIETITIKTTHFITCDQVRDLEQILRLHLEMEINLEGVAAIAHLLKRITALQEELIQLRNRLNRLDFE